MRININQMEVYRLERELPTHLQSFNHLASIVKSVLKTDDIPGNYAEAYSELVSFVVNGFPSDSTLRYCSLIKGVENEVNKAYEQYNLCKEVENKLPEYYERIVYEKGEYKWKDIDLLLNDLAGEYIEGETAELIYKATNQLLNSFNQLSTISEGVLGSIPLALPRAINLIRATNSMELEINHIAVQTLADAIDQNNLSEDEKKILDYLMKTYNEKSKKE